jgi:hypothetical protein
MFRGHTSFPLLQIFLPPFYHETWEYGKKSKKTGSKAVVFFYWTETMLK